MRIRIVDAGRTTIIKIAQTLGSASIADGSITTAKLADEAVTLAKLAEDVTSELGGASAHGDLTGRDAADSHPTSAITGLDAALAAKATPSDISTAIATHAAAVDPHPTYTTAAELAAGIAAIPSDGAAGTASLRTLGTGATQATAGNDARLSDTRTPTDASVTTAKLSAALAAAIARLTAKRATSSTTSTLATTDRFLAIGTGGGNHTCTLPTVASASGLDFWIKKSTTDSNTITLALDAGDTGAKIYYRGNAPLAGVSLTITDSSLNARPGFMVWTDGTDWYIE